MIIIQHIFIAILTYFIILAIIYIIEFTWFLSYSIIIEGINISWYIIINNKTINK